MNELVLVTGGAGFIGQRLCRGLLQHGFRVRVLDNFSDQVHAHRELPADIRGQVELIRGDVRNRADVVQALSGIDVLVHLAAETGTGQSMYKIAHYFDVNVQATALLLDVLQNEPVAPECRSLIVASSRAIYGEGAFTCSLHGLVFPGERLNADLEAGLYDPFCPQCRSVLKLVATPEQSPFQPLSYYGLSKQIQEQAILMFAQSRGLTGIGLRYQNVYGPGQSLKNPYTGILAVFTNLARQAKDIEVYEDGLESRDFVFVDDVVAATLRAVEIRSEKTAAFNVGTGVPTSVMEVAESINNFFGAKSKIRVSGMYRMGDIRHNIADMSLAQQALNFQAKTTFDVGLRQFLEWATSETMEDTLSYERSLQELRAQGLIKER